MANILGVQIIGILFGIFMVYYTFLNYKRRELKIGELLFWTLLWIMFTIIILIPEVLDPIVKRLNFARTLDMLIIIGFMFLIGVSFYVYSVTRKNENRIEQLVRELAIKKEKNARRKNN